MFKSGAAPHPEGVVQIGIFSSFAENTAVAGEDLRCLTPARGEYLHLEWVCLGYGVVILYKG